MHDEFICPVCGHISLQSQSVNRTHVFQNYQITTTVCDQCSDQEPCVASLNGVHGEIYDYDDLADQQNHIAIPLFLYGAPPGQIGICSLCKQWQVWDIGENRWRDPLPLDV